MARFAALAFIAIVGACGSTAGEPALVCVDAANDLACTPAYEPTFANIFEQTLKPRCGYGGSACHTSTGRQRGIVFAEPDEGYATLKQTFAVRPGRPDCSPAIHRIDATDPNVRMPPGEALEPAVRCAVVQWIAAGAPR